MQIRNLELFQKLNFRTHFQIFYQCEKLILDSYQMTTTDTFHIFRGKIHFIWRTFDILRIGENLNKNIS